MNISTKVNEIRLSECLHRQKKISKIIRARRSIYAGDFIKKEIPDKLLEEILINALWAPNHKMTEPWRFLVLKDSYLEQYGIFMADYFSESYSELSAQARIEKLEYLKNYPLNAACLIGIVMVRNTKINLPEWEEIAAISSAVQNIALTCTAYNIGNYWSTKQVAIDYVSQFGLADNEKSLGLLYLGYYPSDLKISKKKRTPISKKVSFLK